MSVDNAKQFLDPGAGENAAAGFITPGDIKNAIDEIYADCENTDAALVGLVGGDPAQDDVDSALGNNPGIADATRAQISDLAETVALKLRDGLDTAYSQTGTGGAGQTGGAYLAEVEGLLTAALATAKTTPVVTPADGHLTDEGVAFLVSAVAEGAAIITQRVVQTAINKVIAELAAEYGFTV